MTNEKIKDIALATGFKIKKQPDGTDDLNPYVYEFAKNLIAVTLDKAQSKLAYIDDPYDTVASNAIIDRFDDVLESLMDEVWGDGFSSWICVDDRLPEKTLQQCLIAHKEGGVMEAEYHSYWVKTLPPVGGHKQYFKTHNNEYDLQGDYIEITHWQPLLTPPSEVIDE